MSSDVFKRPWPPVNLSHGTAQKAETCTRALFWHVYWAWGAWRRGPNANSSSRRLAYALKKGQSAKALAGLVVHEYAANWAKNPDELVPEFDKAIATFRNRLSWTVTEPDKASKNRPLNLDAFYDRGPTNPEAEQVIEMSIAGLLMSTHMQDAHNGKVLSVEDLKGMETDLAPGKGTVWYAADLVYQDEDDRIVVVDWKTGKPHDSHRQQLTLYAGPQWAKEPAKVVGVASYLSTGEYTEWELDWPECEAAESRLTGWLVEEMRSRVIDGDLEENSPIMGPEVWPQLPEDSAACGWCDYRRLCKR